MLAYLANKSQFMEDVGNNVIHLKIQKSLGSRVGQSEVNSWRNSLGFMERVIRDVAIPNDAGIAIEFQIPLTAKRVDFILSGKNDHDRECAVIVELKQWSDVLKTPKDGIVITRFGGRLVETSHPSYQAWTYAVLIQDYNEAVQTDDIALAPCAYLHNLDSDEVINDDSYAEYTEKAPSFISSDVAKLASFIKRHVKYGDSGNIMYRIENGKIRPSKSLVDHLTSMLNGNREFLMIDDQKLVFETSRMLAGSAQLDGKEVMIVHGGPGTGKSVVAVNLLVELTAAGMVVNYVSKNRAPREVYTARLAQDKMAARIRNLFKGSGGYVNSKCNDFDALIVDEAHRLNEKSGLYMNLGDNQIKEIIRASRFSVFFLDEDQRVTFRDIGEASEIKKFAEEAGANITELSLLSQFRCNGSDGYLAWVDHSLQVRETANTNLEDIDYDFRVFNNPKELHEAIVERNKLNNKARVVAGYCWDWASKKNSIARDIRIDAFGYTAQWNLDTDGPLWIQAPDSVAEVGCIHTCQGLELDYVGVIIGPDLIVRNGKVITDASQRSKNDSSVRGYKKLLKSDPDEARERADLIIKNTYRTLMTRGLKGCYLFCTDPETNEYFQSARSADVEFRPTMQAAEEHPDY